MLLNKTSHEDTIGHLFIVDIKFHNIKEKTLLLNEIYPPILEKKKRKWNHLTLKKYVPLYVEHLHFLVKRAGWLGALIYEHSKSTLQ